MGVSAALTARLAAAESELHQVAEAIDAPRKTAVTVDDVVGNYRRQVLSLEEALTDDNDRIRTRQILADMLGTVTIGREGGETFAELDEPAERLLIAAVGESLGLVAGAGFEPTTFGL